MAGKYLGRVICRLGLNEKVPWHGGGGGKWDLSDIGGESVDLILLSYGESDCVEIREVV